MTDEEMAVNWVRSQGWNEENLPSDEFGQMVQAYLAGLKAVKDTNVATRWHDLRKNPTDVPKENVTVLLLTEVESLTARYDNKYEAFFRLNNKLDYCVFIAPMSYIAWCELPKYDKE